ncbi:MAG: class I SAM-dependent methyltransferase [gamma proteobacterium symbiont of Taylorina sp.]|nr:class I SAM-dependent methyltransferase [gamma proteobacterium symbiont of Taylorina sp.]
MNINFKSIQKTCPEAEIIESVLLLNYKNILELGCGDASITRLIASSGEGRIITATEVDQIQHQKNLQIDDLHNVDFKLAGSEKIPADDNTFDIVFMFKSLHHVPIDLMDKALQEVRRVLRTRGLVYISEPVFDGDFNEILRLFHDEKLVRQSAFEAIKKSVDNNVFSLVDEIFFCSPFTFNNFKEFEERIIGVTHTEHHLSNDLYTEVKKKFEYYYQKNSGNFLIPNRVDILTK